MIVRAIVVASAVAALGLSFSSALAEDGNVVAAPFAASPLAVEGVSLYEPRQNADGFSLARGFSMEVSRHDSAGAAQFTRPDHRAAGNDHRRFEVSAVARDLVGSPVDVSVNQRALLRVSPDGDVNGASEGAEVRVGSRLSRFTKNWADADWSHPNWYVYAASDNEQLAWSPRATTGSSVRYREDRVKIGDMQAGFALEAGGVQAAIAYVQRDIQGRYGTAEENFTGVTVSWRR